MDRGGDDDQNQWQTQAPSATLSRFARVNLAKALGYTQSMVARRDFRERGFIGRHQL